MSDETAEEAPKPKKKRRKRNVDWALLIMLVGTVLFIVVFGAITVMAPRRPFLALRGLGPSVSKPPPAGAAPATAVPTPVLAVPTPATSKP